MSRIQGVRKAVLAGFVAVGLSSTAFAQTSAPATDLGQAWPHTADVSASPDWHVYVFWAQGIKYVQVNDLSGNVHAAIGTANGTTIVLPAGVDSQNIVITERADVASQVNAARTAAVSATQVVYQDAATSITAAPKKGGGTQFSVQTKCDPLNCSSAVPSVQ